MTNVLYINTSDCVGGAAKVAWNLGHNLRNGFDSKYITYNKKSTDHDVYKIPDSALIRVLAKVSSKKWSDLAHYLKGFVLSNDIDFGFGWSELKSNPYYLKSDIVHLNNLHGNYFKLNTLTKINKPMVWTLHDEWAIMPHGACSDYFDRQSEFFKCRNLTSYPPMLFNNEEYLMTRKRSIYQQINPVLVVPSRWLKKRVEKSILADKVIKLIPNGVNTDIYKMNNKINLRRKLKLPLDKKIILFLASGGKDNPHKGWEHANRIISDMGIRDCVFLCIGGSGEKPSKDGNILYIPYISSEAKLAEYYSASDIFLLTSNHENFPLTTLEAMSAGLPVIAFDVGGVSEQIVEGKTGFIAKMLDYEKIENIIISIFDNDKLLDEMSLNASDHVKYNFSLSKMVNSYTKLYESLIKQIPKKGFVTGAVKFPKNSS